MFRKQTIQILKQKHYLKAPNVYFKDVGLTTSIVSGVYVVAEISIISPRKFALKVVSSKLIWIVSCILAKLSDTSPRILFGDSLYNLASSLLFSKVNMSVH